ncbi:MAG: SDR family NAD(P)-dependent oxidoreductase, partial [Rhodospirillaceae bacterium]|nr:SDR family NAD(P)-dependent oxidoreductase [Rhodospirillaceae bacterium]
MTGGARGIGAAIARRLAAQGARVVIADRDEITAKALAAEVGAHAIALDVADAAQVRKAFAATGPFDILVNNAGIDQHAFFTDTTEGDWHRLIGVNL